jgi:paraquat-inducible protein A
MPHKVYPPEVYVTAQEQHLCQCPVCLTLNNDKQTHCSQCNGHLHLLNPKAIQQTIALLITAVLLFIPANFMPMMTTIFLGDKTESTILGGVILLWEHQSYLVAIIIFLASIVIPVGKIIALSWLCYAVKKQTLRSRKTEHKLYRLIEFIGRWSMVDVFVVAILVAMIQLGPLMSIQPGIASISFAGLVITTMLAAMTFDPRIIWQFKF